MSPSQPQPRPPRIGSARRRYRAAWEGRFRRGGVAVGRRAWCRRRHHAAAARKASAAALLLAVVLPISAAPASAELARPEKPPSEVRRAVRDVLARPEYRRPSPTILERARRWVVDQLERLLGTLAGGGRAAFIAWGVLGAGLVTVAVLVFRFARGVTPDAARRGPAGAELRRSAAEWRSEAEDHERAGRWREALRCRYRALVADLDGRGLVDEVPGRTAGEYRAEVAANAPVVAPAFGGATELFERAWYGNRPSDADDAARLRDLSERVLEGVGG